MRISHDRSTTIVGCAAACTRSAGLAVACGVVVFVGAAHAQGDPAETHHGAFVLRSNAQMGLVIHNPAALAGALNGADKILAILRRDDALSAPVGYSAVVSRAAGMTSSGGDSIAPGLPAHWGVTGGLDYFATEDDGRGGQRVSDDGGRFDISVIVNGIGMLSDVEQVTPALDHGPPILQGYRVTGTFRGHDVYNGECVFIARRPGVPPFVPVTKERYLRLRILKARADSARHTAEHRTMDEAPGTSAALQQWIRDKPTRQADMQKTYDALKTVDRAQAETLLVAWKRSEAEAGASLREAASSGADDRIKQIEREGTAGEGHYIASLVAQLDSLSPADKKSQAAVLQLGVDGEKLGMLDDPESVPLVQINAAFFDKTSPVTVPQLVSVCLPGLQEGVEVKRYEWSDRRAHDAGLVRDRLDWAALEALVEP
ncbi:MAG TPA: hypothetical protein VHV78_18420 [Gemmatimonadaceae bacterium]|jgi:hypothetical protein|nr:hypothetical protein [Gemmatimonadaceae bacterium]